MLSKPQDINITVTAQHIYGTAYICDQTGVKEDDPTYSRFTCGLGEITKIYINNNNKMAPNVLNCNRIALWHSSRLWCGDRSQCRSGFVRKRFLRK